MTSRERERPVTPEVVRAFRASVARWGGESGADVAVADEVLAELDAGRSPEAVIDRVRRRGDARAATELTRAFQAALRASTMS